MGNTVTIEQSSAPDFDELGRDLQKSKSVGDRRLNVIWEHPTSHAQLFVGDHSIAHDADDLKAYGISRIVCCLEKCSRPLQREMRYFHFPIAMHRKCTDSGSEEGIAKFFAPVLGFISQNLSDGHSILVHCLAGAHRAGTTGIASLMHLADLDLQKAISEAQSKRRIIDPIYDFRALLWGLQSARKQGLMESALQEAEKMGVEKANEKVFGRDMSGVLSGCLLGA